MEAHEALLETLERELRCVDRLLGLGRQKQERLDDHEQLALITAQEDAILERLQQAETQRQTLFDVIAPGRTLRAWLADEGELQRKFAPVVERLASAFVELRAVNDTNTQLIAESLAYVRFSLNLLNHSGPTVYGRSGHKDVSHSLFNRKV